MQGAYRAGRRQYAHGEVTGMAWELGQGLERGLLPAMEAASAALNRVVWGPPLLALLLAAGALLTWRTGFFPVRQAPAIAQNTLLALLRSDPQARQSGQGSLSQFQALSTALAATIGTGNIAGVAAAVAAGGPGTVLWMWVSALLGMSLKYAEAALAVRYRRRGPEGRWKSGAMYYLEASFQGRLAPLGRGLACAFALFCALAALGIGNMTQANSLAAALKSGFGLPPALTGAAAAVLVGVVALRGMGAVGRLTERLVPFMAAFYIAACLAILAMNLHRIPHMFSSILENAFDLRAVAGGAGGAAMGRAAVMGLKRGIFSNEAGLGSSAAAHGAARTSSPAQQGMWGVAEVFVDTLVLCSLTAFTILCASSTALPLETALQQVTLQPQFVTLSPAQAPNASAPSLDARLQDAPAGETPAPAPLVTRQARLALPARIDAQAQGPTRAQVYGRSARFASLTPQPGAAVTYGNIALLRGIPLTDPAGNPILDSRGSPHIQGLELQPVEGVALVTYAFSQVFGGAAGQLLCVAVSLFAFSTLLSWSFYGAGAVEYLLGRRAVPFYRALFTGFIWVGAVTRLDLVWEISDTLNGLMALPNLTGLMALSGQVSALTQSYLAQRRQAAAFGAKGA